MQEPRHDPRPDLAVGGRWAREHERRTAQPAARRGALREELLDLGGELRPRGIGDVRVRLEGERRLESARLAEVLLVGDDEEDAWVRVAEPPREAIALAAREVGGDHHHLGPARRVQLVGAVRVLRDEHLEPGIRERAGDVLARGAVALGEEDARHGRALYVRTRGKTTSARQRPDAMIRSPLRLARGRR